MSKAFCRSILLAAAAASAISCGDPAAPPQAVAMAVVGAPSLNGIVGTVVSPAARIKVVDDAGNPVSGVTMSFVAAGGGTLASPTAVSDAEGIVTAPAWTLGTVAGPNGLTASAQGLTGSPATFTVAALAGPPATITITGGDGQIGIAGTLLASAPIVRVADAFDNAVPNAAVVFSVTEGGGTVNPGQVSTNGAGLAAPTTWRLGPLPGTNTVIATASGTSVSATFNATGQRGPAAMTLFRGGSQIAFTGSAVDELPTVQVVDGAGAPFEGAIVTFSVVAGGGSITGTSVTTGTDGLATLGSWTLGPTASLNTVRATGGASGVPLTVQFNASGCGGGGADFRLTLCFTSDMTAGQRLAFTSAAARWENLITADLPEEVMTEGLSAGSCGSASFRIPRNFVIDDLLIFAAVVNIDGPGAVLGSAGPCFIRDVGFLSVIGTMRFDAADMSNLEGNGSLNAVILHEMGHVLGIGSLWSTFGLLVDPSASGGTQRDTYFNGVNAVDAFNAIGGGTYTGQKVPVENNPAFGPGTVNGHWRESVLRTELMTGFINSNGANPLSVLTVGSLQDLGYTVNVAGADPFFLTLAASGGPGASSVQMIDDVYTGPLYRLDALGRSVRIR